MKQPINMHDQQGATLIVVLLVLLLIMIAGAMAVRQSRTDLQVATSDQINTVLLQTADNANQKLEQVINGETSDQTYFNLTEHTSGFIGYFYNRKDRANDEVIYCQTEKEQTYLVSGATVLRNGGTVYNKGYCANGSKLRYTSDRGTMVGQVSISPSADNVTTNDDDNVLGSYVTGQNIAGTSSQRMRFDIYSTAAVPAYSGASKAANCFNRTSKPTTKSDGTKDYKGTVSGCLIEENVPQTSVYQQADISRYATAKSCKGFGTSSGDADSDTKVSAICQLQ